MGKLDELTSSAAVAKALAKFDQIGRERFLEEYGFGRSREYYVAHDGCFYDSKPVVAAAYGFQHGRANALAFDDFSGGDATVRPKLAALGYKVSALTSPRLKDGALYTRKELMQKFHVKDATINTGVFRPAGTNSLWLFVTEDKTRDRTQYRDRLEGDLLMWQGQLKGRRDSAIVSHRQNGDELLVFYRRSKREHPGAAFRYQGRFTYLDHNSGPPANFRLQRLNALLEELPADPPFDPENLEDGRQQILALVKRRQGQARFRRELLRAYGGACAISRCSVEPLLEAAHIYPWKGKETNHVSNGLLLRADLHTLFDLGLITIGSDCKIRVAERLQKTDYGKLDGTSLASPKEADKRPSQKALAWHRSHHAPPGAT